MSLITFMLATEFFLVLAFIILVALFLRNGGSRTKHKVREDIQKIKEQISQ